MMNSSLLSTRHIQPIWMVPLLLTLLTGCETIMDMDKVIAPPDLLWEKKGVSGKTKDIEMRQCVQHPFKISSAESWEAYDTCLLRKGYKFIPRPRTLSHWEKDGASYVRNLNDKILVECANKNPGDTLSIEELYANLDILKSCMSNKGYTYKPSDGTYANICSRSEFFNDRIACKSTRWGFTLPPEK